MIPVIMITIMVMIKIMWMMTIMVNTKLMILMTWR